MAKTPRWRWMSPFYLPCACQVYCNLSICLHFTLVMKFYVSWSYIIGNCIFGILACAISLIYSQSCTNEGAEVENSCGESCFVLMEECRNAAERGKIFSQWRKLNEHCMSGPWGAFQPIVVIERNIANLSPYIKDFSQQEFTRKISFYPGIDGKCMAGGNRYLRYPVSSARVRTGKLPVAEPVNAGGKFQLSYLH